MSQRSKKQSVVPESNVESKYRAVTNLTCDLVWVKDLLPELGFTLESPMRMYIVTNV